MRLYYYSIQIFFVHYAQKVYFQDQYYSFITDEFKKLGPTDPSAHPYVIHEVLRRTAETGDDSNHLVHRLIDNFLRFVRRTDKLDDKQKNELEDFIQRKRFEPAEYKPLIYIVDLKQIQDHRIRAATSDDESYPSSGEWMIIEDLNESEFEIIETFTGLASLEELIGEM